MEYKVKIWIRDKIIACCSQMCDKDCPNFNKCKEVTIVVKED